jgi:hypothetical protein
MPKRKEPEINPKEQFKEFMKTAREIGAGDARDEVEKAFKSLARKTKPTPKPKAARSRHE